MNVRLFVFRTRNPLTKLHLFRQDLQDYQDFFDLVYLYPVHPACQGEAFLRSLVDPVKKRKANDFKFSNRLSGSLQWPAAGLNCEPETYIGASGR